jgi:hypothetical protein
MNRQLDKLDLPPVNLRHWTARQKAAVVLAIGKKAITVQEACELYNLSIEELAEWERDVASRLSDTLT